MSMTLMSHIGNEKILLVVTIFKCFAFQGLLILVSKNIGQYGLLSMVHGQQYKDIPQQMLFVTLLFVDKDRNPFGPLMIHAGSLPSRVK